MSNTDRKDFIRYPTNRVVGTIGDATSAQSTVGALLQAGFTEQDIDVLHGEEDLHRLDATGAEHGFFAQFQRTLIRTFDLEEFKHLTHHVEDIRAGRFVVMVLARRRGQRMVAADVLHRYGAEFVGFYGRWAWEGLPAAPQTSPEAIAASFARAWNDGNADALGSLFDDDAEFVDAAGHCLHDRESIRKAHASGLDGTFGRSTLSIAEAKVKRLSPDIAVVHTRMTLAGQAPRVMIVSFVVHRDADRWLCTSAHTTDVMPHAGVSVADDAVRFRSANYPSGPAV